MQQSTPFQRNLLLATAYSSGLQKKRQLLLAHSRWVNCPDAVDAVGLADPDSPCPSAPVPRSSRLPQGSCYRSLWIEDPSNPLSQRRGLTSGGSSQTQKQC